MNHRVCCGPVGLLRACALPVGWILFAALPHAMARGGELPFESQRLVIRVDKETFELGVPISVYAELANPNPWPTRSHRGYGWYHSGGTGASWLGYLSLNLRRDGAGFHFKPRGMPFINIPAPDAILMPPGARLRTKTLVVGPLRNGEVLASPGTMQMIATFAAAVGPRSVLRTETLRVALVQPKGRDAEALEILRRRDLLPYLGYVYFLQPVKNEDIRGLSDFLEKYADTVYAPYAAFGLGQMYFYRERYAEAIETLGRLVAKHPKCSVAEDALYIVAESFRRQKNLPDAEKSFREVIKRYPDTPAADDAEAELEKIARDPTMLFRGDQRLDVAIILDIPPATLIEDALQSVSRLSGVPLRVAPEIRQTRLWGGQPRKVTLRQFMSELDRSDHRRWFPEPDGGYRLVSIKALAAPKEPPKPATTKPRGSY